MSTRSGRDPSDGCRYPRHTERERESWNDRAFQRASVSLDRRSLSSIYFNGRYFHPCHRRRHDRHHRRQNWRLRAKVNTERAVPLFLHLLPRPARSLFTAFFIQSETRRRIRLSYLYRKVSRRNRRGGARIDRIFRHSRNLSICRRRDKQRAR